MPGDLLEIAKLENDYPVLKNFWKIYKYEEDPSETDDTNLLFSLCKDNSLLGNRPTNDQKNACKKLLKNWGLLCSTERSVPNQKEWCDSINHWIYYEINPKFLNNKIINDILIKAQADFFRFMPNKQYCTFTNLNENHVPQALNKLRIFNENTSTFRDILKNTGHDYYCSCRKFVKDCINIYKTIKREYCSNANDIHTNNKETCAIVNNFNLYYTGYIYNVIGVLRKLPNLSSTTDINININMDGCPLHINGKGFDSVRGDQSDGSAVSTTPTEASGKTVPTAIGTIVGVSSVLGLLYKFSPAGTWMHSGLRGNGRIINSNLYSDGGRELLTDGPLMENLNSYNIGYEVA